MSRNRLFWTGLLALTAAAGGCAFKKATPGEITGSGGTTGDNDGGDPNDVPSGAGMDIIAPPMMDAPQFEAEASQNCIEANPTTMNLPPDVLIVLDRSGSMTEDLSGNTCNGGCGATSKWSIATMTLASYLPTVETTVNWGLKLFASGNTGGSCTVSSGAEVMPAPMNASAITQRLSPVQPGSSTPTTMAVMAASAYLKTLNDGNPKFILLATDGIPTCGSAMCAAGVNTGGSLTQCDDANAIAAVKSVHDNDGIPTFVLGIGTANSPGDSTLSQMAVNGGFPRASTPSYYPIGSADDLTQAFQAITQTVGQCFFSVTPVPKSATDITGVTGDGNPIPQDGTDGWTFVTMGGASGVQLNGKSCDDYKNKVIQSVVVQLPCVIP